jgi:hypothetical protein
MTTLVNLCFHLNWQIRITKQLFSYDSCSLIIEVRPRSDQVLTLQLSTGFDTNGSVHLRLLSTNKSECPLSLGNGRSPYGHINQRLQTQFRAPTPLETCWAFKKLWNNKLYYKVASCWYLYWVFNRLLQQILKNMQKDTLRKPYFYFWENFRNNREQNDHIINERGRPYLWAHTPRVTCQ